MQKRLVIFHLLFVLSTLSWAAENTASNPVPDVNFENEETFIDQSDAIGSKQYVRRAILSSVIRETSRFSFQRLYVSPKFSPPHRVFGSKMMPYQIFAVLPFIQTEFSERLHPFASSRVLNCVADKGS